MFYNLVRATRGVAIQLNPLDEMWHVYLISQKVIWGHLEKVQVCNSLQSANGRPLCLKATQMSMYVPY